MAWCSKCENNKALKKNTKKTYVMFLANSRKKKPFKKGLKAMPMVFKKK